MCLSSSLVSRNPLFARKEKMETRIRGTIKKTMRCKNVLDRIHLCVSRILVIVKKIEHFLGRDTIFCRSVSRIPLDPGLVLRPWPRFPFKMRDAQKFLHEFMFLSLYDRRS